MSRVLKVLGLWLLVAAMVLLFTMWHWQQTERDVDLYDIVMQLVVFPTALVGSWLLAMWGLQRWKDRKPAVQSDTAQQDGGVVGSADNSRHAYALVVDAALHTRVGMDPSAALSEVQSGEQRPGLDPSLQDYEGMPVFSARVEDVAVDELLPVPDEEGEAAYSEAAARAAFLLQAPCEQLMQSWSTLMETWAQSHAPSPSAEYEPADWSGKAYLSGVAHPKQREGQARTQQLQWTVRLLLPARWTVANQELVVSQVRSRMMPLIEQAQSLGMAPPVWQVIPPATPEAWWLEWDQAVTRWHREGSAEAMLILAVDSAMDEATVEQWQSIGELFTAQHQTGRIPGEAATGLLVVSPALGAQLDAKAMPQQPIRLSRPVCLKRDKSADAAGRVGATVLADAITQALDVAGLKATENMMVIADADHRASRTSELFEALQSLIPGLDPTTQVARAGEVLGDVGVARSLLSTALGCAAVWTAEGDSVALATHVHAPHERVVLALTAAGEVNAAAV